jgi:hypothetical protein
MAWRIKNTIEDVFVSLDNKQHGIHPLRLVFFFLRAMLAY